MSSTETHTRGERYDDEDVVETVEALYDAGETERYGGVHFRTVAEELGRPEASAREKLRTLSQEGKLDRTYAFQPGFGKVWTYVPVEDEDDDTLVTDGGTCVDGTEQLEMFERRLQAAAESEEFSLYTTLRHNAEDISVQAEGIDHSNLRVWLEDHDSQVVQAETGGYFCVRPYRSVQPDTDHSRGERDV